MMGLMLFVSVLLILLAVRKVEENERWFEGLRQRELERRQRIEKAARFWDEKTGEEKGWDEPLTETDMLTVRSERSEVRGEELRRIVEAMIVETCSARDDVRKRKINEAEAKLHLVIGCLTGLIERMKDEGGMMKNEEVRP
jgi:predicted ATPase